MAGMNPLNLKMKKLFCAGRSGVEHTSESRRSSGIKIVKGKLNNSGENLCTTNLI
jgi:hypothetical protein